AAAGQVGGSHASGRAARGRGWRRETAVRCALRTLALAGDRAGGLALFKAFASRLKRDLGAEPDAETRALTERVRLERAWRLPKAGRNADARGSASRRAPLVGRALELARLTDAWTACRAKGQATVVVIEGDAGAGKTRLAEELVARTRLDGAVVAAVRAVAADQGDAWSGVFGIARGGLLEAPGVAGAPPDALAQLRGTAPVGALGRALTEVLQAVADEQLDRLARRVLADSAGIPLLVVALLHAVAAGFEPSDAPHPWPKPTETFEQTLPGDLPDNVVAAIRINFRRLSADAQRVLVATAVLGGRVAGA